MDTILCHTCFQRNDKEAIECEHCHVQLKEVKDETIVSDFIQSLTKLANRQKIGNPREFKIVILFNFLLGINFLLIATLLYIIHPFTDVNVKWFIFGFYATAIISLLITLRLVGRRRSAIKGFLYMLPIQVTLLTAFVIDIKSYMIEANNPIIPAWLESFQQWYVFLMIYCIMVATIFSLQVYFMLFNSQVRRQLVF